ncbi:MAG: hypothetical protein IJ272_08070 [Clostridia bacterium]|nr:hypothetical protein [Clostridia bacterium]
MLFVEAAIDYTRKNIKGFIEKGREPMPKCTTCSKFPFCDIAPQDNCNEWIKRSYDTKLVKVDGLNYKFERIDEI